MTNDIYHLVITDYSAPVDIYYDFHPGGNNLIETRVRLDAPPCSEIIFGISCKGDHAGTNTQDLGGGISPQSRRRETLHREIIEKVYQEESNFQKRCFFSPLSVSLDITLEARGISAQDIEFIKKMPNSESEFIRRMERNALKSIVLYRMLYNKKLTRKGCHLEAMEQCLMYARRAFLRSVLYHDKCSRNKNIRKTLLPLLIR